VSIIQLKRLRFRHLAGSPEWVSRGIVNLPKRPPPPPEPEGEPTFAVEGLEAQVFTSESSSPRGLCFALPRYNKDVENSPIELLGIICQGNDKSKACFWDNQEEVEVAPGMKVRTNVAIPRNEMRELTKLAGGAQLNGGSGGVCSDCHAGENAFVIHPGTALTEVGAAKLKPNNWHEPLVHPSWPHNPGPTNLLDGIVLGQGERACTSCHNQSIAGFPEVSRNLMSYCTTVLKKAVKRTMPPANINLMPPDSPGDPNELYSTHRTVLLAECDKVPRWIGSNNDPRPGNSPANSFSPCFPAGSPCPVKKTVEFKLSEDEEVLIRYDLGQSHGCCADHSVGILRILLDGTEVLNDQVPYVNYGVQPISEFLEDFDYFFPPEVVKGRRAPVSHLDSTRVGPILTSYKLVNRFSLGNLPAGPHNLELWVGDAGWNSILEIYHRF
jgi:hypothetical protein